MAEARKAGSGESATERERALCVRALAMPPKFGLAPFYTTVALDGAVLLGGGVYSVTAGSSALILICVMVTHLVMILVGLAEPQTDALLWSKMGRMMSGKARGMSRTQRARYPGARGVYSSTP